MEPILTVRTLVAVQQLIASLNQEIEEARHVVIPEDVETGGIPNAPAPARTRGGPGAGPAQIS